jgi:hypothetical protein
MWVMTTAIPGLVSSMTAATSTTSDLHECDGGDRPDRSPPSSGFHVH